MTWRSHNGETSLEIRQGDALAAKRIDAEHRQLRLPLEVLR